MASPIARKLLGIIHKPKWLKHAEQIEKAGLRFLNYKRDLLSENRVDEIKSRVRDLRKARTSGTQAETNEAIKQLEGTCETALPHYKHPNAIAENLEVFFVAIVVALGLRAYFLQPFRIPTGSMQPTLNGIRAEQLPLEKHPNIVVGSLEKITKGRSYVYAKTDTAKRLRSDYLEECMVEKQRFWFFTYTYLFFEDGSKISIHAPKNELLNGLGLANILKPQQVAGPQGQRLHLIQRDIPANTVLASGYSDAGDMVFVDKFSYNFRKPKRGEVFVFDTRGIEGIQKRSGPQGAGSHYIKRLVGVPGDKMNIHPPVLNVNDQPAKEEKIAEVMNSEGAFKGQPGYQLAGYDGHPTTLSRPDQSVTLNSGNIPQLREYFALGDNTDNSLDSKYWGAVRQFNLIGPAAFSLWPFSTGHKWGLIE